MSDKLEYGYPVNSPKWRDEAWVGALSFQSPLSLLSVLSLTLALRAPSNSTVVCCGCEIVGWCTGRLSWRWCSEMWPGRWIVSRIKHLVLFLNKSHTVHRGTTSSQAGLVVPGRILRAVTAQCSGLPKVGRNSDLLFTMVQRPFSVSWKRGPGGFCFLRFEVLSSTDAHCWGTPWDHKHAV